MASWQSLQQAVGRVVCGPLGCRLRLGTNRIKSREVLGLCSMVGVGGNVCSLVSGISMPVRLLRAERSSMGSFRVGSSPEWRRERRVTR